MLVQNQIPSFLAAARGTRPTVPPVWFMRQAGRSLPEYRKAREGVSMLDACLRPELAAEITLQPVRRHGVDAAIFFSDIVTPLRLAGIDVDIKPGVGPVMGKAYRTSEDLTELTSHEPGDHALIREAIGITTAELDTLPTRDANGAEMLGVPLIGFAGAPFTLAAYLVEGRPSKDHIAARTLMHAAPEMWAQLMTWTADLSGEFLREQVVAGAQAVQLFDSWAGSLSREDYINHVLPYSKRALDHVPAGIPKIHFGLGTGEFIVDMAQPADVIGVDYRQNLARVINRIEAETSEVPTVQGNINPAMLFAPFEKLTAHASAVLEAGEPARAHIVNLGHGVPPTTDADVLTRLVEFIHGGTK